MYTQEEIGCPCAILYDKTNIYMEIWTHIIRKYEMENLRMLHAPTQENQLV
jgi:hypothetical protein